MALLLTYFSANKLSKCLKKLEDHSMALLMEKKSRRVWTIYEKWSVVEALLGSGMSVTEYCKDRARIGEP